ncbi:MAG: hypothetical protein ACRDSF_00025 [Pseudonocardiaceae bacterium]
MTNQKDRLESYADAVRLVHELRQRGAEPGDIQDAQHAADSIKEHVRANRTTPVRRTPMAEKLFGISAKPTHKEKKFHKENGFWKKIF